MTIKHRRCSTGAEGVEKIPKGARRVNHSGNECNANQRRCFYHNAKKTISMARLLGSAVYKKEKWKMSIT